MQTPAEPAAPFLTDRPALRDWRDDRIEALIDHNLAVRLQLATLRPDLGRIPGPCFTEGAAR